MSISRSSENIHCDVDPFGCFEPYFSLAYRADQYVEMQSHRLSPRLCITNQER